MSPFPSPARNVTAVCPAALGPLASHRPRSPSEHAVPAGRQRSQGRSRNTHPSRSRIAAITCAAALSALTGASPLPAEESPALPSSLQPPPQGLARLELLSETPAVVPGQSFTLGLLIEPAPGHHTYWRSPGIVGVATSVEWTLPDGFVVGELLWPPPEIVSMAGILAQGYGTAALLLAEIQTPAETTGDTVEIRARCSWMACAASCHPGHAELSLRLPIVRDARDPPLPSTDPANQAAAALFEAAHRALPRPAPASWRFRPRTLEPDRISLEIVIPGHLEPKPEGLRFYSDDLQVDPNGTQTLAKWEPLREEDEPKTRIVLELPRSDYGPESPPALKGLLHLPGDWDGIGEWVEVRAGW